jgi:hypothetical protein
MQQPTLIAFLLAAPVAFGQLPSVPAIPARTLAAVAFQGGSPEDRSFASAALGLEVGKPVGDEGFLLALSAVRATDRFRSVAGRLEEAPQGLVARIELEPWPAIQQRELLGDLPRALRKRLFTGMHKGGRAGDLRLRHWQVEAEQRLSEAGYAEAKVHIDREEGTWGSRPDSAPGRGRRPGALRGGLSQGGLRPQSG